MLYDLFYVVVLYLTFPVCHIVPVKEHAEIMWQGLAQTVGKFIPYFTLMFIITFLMYLLTYIYSKDDYDACSNNAGVIGDNSW